MGPRIPGMPGCLRDPSGKIHPLAANSDIGRTATRFVHVDSLHASSRHADISWRKGVWQLTDVGSTNGTRVNGLKLPRGEPRVLRRGDRIAFGTTDQEWVVESVDPPAVLARRVRDGAVVVGLGETLLLPTEDDPEATLFRDPSTGKWWCEVGERAWEPGEEEVVQLTDAWQLYIPPESPRTKVGPSALNITNVVLHLRADRSEEHVSAWLEHAEGRTELGEAEHWTVAWILAKDRLEDTGPEHDRGWMDTRLLAIETGKNQKSLDMYYSRIRKALVEKRVEDGDQAVEGRPHQRRLGPVQVVLHRE